MTDFAAGVEALLHPGVCIWVVAFLQLVSVSLLGLPGGEAAGRSEGILGYEGSDEWRERRRWRRGVNVFRGLMMLMVLSIALSAWRGMVSSRTKPPVRMGQMGQGREDMLGMALVRMGRKLSAVTTTAATILRTREPDTRPHPGDKPWDKRPPSDDTDIYWADDPKVYDKDKKKDKDKYKKKPSTRQAGNSNSSSNNSITELERCRGGLRRLLVTLLVELIIELVIWTLICILAIVGGFWGLGYIIITVIRGVYAVPVLIVNIGVLFFGPGNNGACLNNVYEIKIAFTNAILYAIYCILQFVLWIVTRKQVVYGGRRHRHRGSKSSRSKSGTSKSSKSSKSRSKHSNSRSHKSHSSKH